MENPKKKCNNLIILPPTFSSNYSRKPKSLNKSKILQKSGKEKVKLGKGKCKYNATQKQYNTHSVYIRHIQFIQHTHMFMIQSPCNMFIQHVQHALIQHAYNTFIQHANIFV